MAGYDTTTLERILTLLRGVENVDNTGGALYLDGPLVVRTNDTLYGHFIAEDDMWWFKPLPDGPKDVE